MSKKGRKDGQVLVEMLLVLPVFLTIVFTIMEMGYMSFQMILLNHATYEVARIGAMTQTLSSGTVLSDCGRLVPLMKRILQSATVSCTLDSHSFQDTQAGVTNADLVVTGSNPIKFVFPLSSILMSSRILCPQGPGGGWCTISATVRMPIERPLAF
ncbi:MAG: TadE/TadG family type IV pilus assembly protein [Elusimicrobia bacterium]|nr:TadE/TadG family type IV pilus assembly protein [Elusimicrobiota bacterium]